MANSIRTPKLGRTPMSRRIAQAVDDEAWQKVRLSMKGISTVKKLAVLKTYYYDNLHFTDDTSDCDICIRIHNYITALARGGQLYPGVSLRKALNNDFNLEVRR